MVDDRDLGPNSQTVTTRQVSTDSGHAVDPMPQVIQGTQRHVVTLSVQGAISTRACNHFVFPTSVHPEKEPNIFKWKNHMNYMAMAMLPCM